VVVSHRGHNGGAANKRAADARARALAPIINELQVAGFTKLSAIADELNQRQVPTIRGARWRATTVARLLAGLHAVGAGHSE
jgi:Recombinase